ARNRAEIEARLGRPAPGAVTVNDVVGMTHAGVSEDVIVTHVQTHGVAAPLAPNDLIVLGQQGVSSRVIQAMQVPPVAAAPVVMQPYPPPPPGFWGPPPYPYYYRPYPRPAVSWGISVGR
ncbi:MAG TPA: hypothetical protein VGX76_21615, partial [Pirellulales bacterium]|nr:hypothetical protein [Pirellulales bacterium]